MTGFLLKIGLTGGLLALAAAIIKSFLKAGRVQKKREAERRIYEETVAIKVAEKEEAARKARAKEAADRVEETIRETKKERDKARGVSGSDVGSALDDELGR